MKFLIDAQLPPTLAQWLIQQGHSAKHVDNIGLLMAGDVAIWNHSLAAGGLIIVTKDENFAECSAYKRRLSR